MKKQIIIALVFAVSSFSFAQKKELKTAEKAIKSKNFAEAKTALTQAEGMMSAMDTKLKDKYYYLNAQALYAEGAGSLGDIDNALASLDKVESGYGAESTQLRQDMSNSLLKKGNTAYEKKEYSEASKYFEQSYRLSTKDTLFLYYAAATAVSVKEYDRALVLYEELRDLGFTGIQKEYYVTEKESGEEVLVDESSQKLYVKAGTHVKPETRVTESKKPEIVKNIALIYVSQGNDEKALEAMKAARAESPDDVNLLLSEANVHYKMGNTEEFKSLLTKATEMDPKNAELQYNLGVISAESDHPEEAKAYYEKAIEIDPTYANAYINISALILASEKPLIEEMNGLGTSAADDKRYNELKSERESLYAEAVPYLEKALEVDNTNVNAAKTLMNIYSSLGETDKYKEMKAKVEAIEGS